MIGVADLLSLARLGLAFVLPATLVAGGWAGAVVWTLAALTDYLDGPLARRAGRATSYGALLDTTADVAFVLGGMVMAARLGWILWAVPASVALSVFAYVVASLQSSRGATGITLARNRIGHSAGVMNYACVGLLTLRAAGWTSPQAGVVLGFASVTTVGLNVGAVAVRLFRRQLA